MNQVSILKLEGHLLALLGSMELSYNADYLQYYGAKGFTQMTSPSSLSWAKNDPEKSRFSKAYFPEEFKKNTFVIIKKATLKLSVIKFSY